MSAATVAEIQCGIAKTPDSAVAVGVQRWLDAMLEDGRPAIVDFDAEAAILLGRMWAEPSLDGFVRNDPRSTKNQSGADLVLAATAITRGTIMVPNDMGDFVRVNDASALPGLFAPFTLSWPFPRR